MTCILDSKKNSLIDSKKQIWGNVAEEEEKKEIEYKKKKEIEENKVKANFGLTGALAKDAVTGNVYNGVLLKWTEPLDAARPNKLWRFYVYKGDEIVETAYLHRQSAYLSGRDDRICDLMLLHPSCSKQHAVIQFRNTSTVDPATGTSVKSIKPYILDLESSNKTYLNNMEIEPSRYYELRATDGIRFGESTREYVLMCDNGKEERKR